MVDKKCTRIIRRIYKNPYITYFELKEMFPETPAFQDIVYFLENEKYISFRDADNYATDKGEVVLNLESAHLLTDVRGNAVMEDHALFRANVSLIFSGMAILLSVLAFFFK